MLQKSLHQLVIPVQTHQWHLSDTSIIHPSMASGRCESRGERAEAAPPRPVWLLSLNPQLRRAIDQKSATHPIRLDVTSSKNAWSASFRCLTNEDPYKPVNHAVSHTAPQRHCIHHHSYDAGGTGQRHRREAIATSANRPCRRMIYWETVLQFGPSQTRRTNYCTGRETLDTCKN